MPKTLVLHADAADTSPLTAFVDGARGIRFSEVDVRTLARVEGSSHEPLDSVDRLADYDAIVLIAPVTAVGSSADVARLFADLTALRASGILRDKVGSAVVTGGSPSTDAAVWSLLTPLAALGLIIVAPTPTPDATSATTLDEAAAHGRRVAKVAEWVRHAKSHAH